MRNKELSLKAKGLLSQMLSLPEDWDLPLRAYPISTGRRSTQSAKRLKELEKAGYIVRSRERDEKGRLRGADYVIYEQPQSARAGSSYQRRTAAYIGFTYIGKSNIG